MGEKRKLEEMLKPFSDQKGEQFTDDPNSKSNRYYGFLSQIEDISEESYPEYTNLSVLFDIVPEEWITLVIKALLPLFNKPRRLPSIILPPPPPASFLLIENIETTKIAKAFSSEKKNDLKEADWYILELGEGLEATRWIAARWKRSDNELNLEPVDKPDLEKVRVKGRKAEDKEQEILGDVFRAKGRFDSDKIRQATTLLNPSREGNDAALGTGSIGVMDVGQASCNLIYNNLRQPVLYFDVGRPNAMYLPSAPLSVTNRSPCPNCTPRYIILSHWHDDHFNMAFSPANIGILTNLVWIVPSQRHGPNAASLFRIIRDANRMNVWPMNHPPFQNEDVMIVGCNANADINNSGLALLINMHNGAPHERVLLPGDAAFQNIQIPANISINYTTAPHHGSRTHLQVPIPIALANHPGMAHSYGIMPISGRHPYRHPSPQAILAYAARAIQATPENIPNTENPPLLNRGNILMCANANTPPSLCVDINCPFHNFPKNL